MPTTFTTYYVQPLRAGVARNSRVAYAEDRLPSLLEAAERPADVLAALLDTYPTTRN